MEKSKLGISIPLTGALIFFLVFVSDLVAILLAAFVLLYEDNEWLKKSAIKMISVIIVSGMFFSVFSIPLMMFFSILDIAFGWIIDIDVPFELDRIGSYVVYAAEKLLLLSFGLKALSMGTIKAKFFDRIINNHM